MTTRTLAAALVLMLTAGAAPALAADDAIVVTSQPVPSVMKMRESATRPALLTTLYASYAGLQAYDVYSTRTAISRGAVEANPLMTGAAGSHGAMIGLKAGITLGTIVAAERMWKKNNRMGAIAVLVASNIVAALVAARNARTLGQVR